MTDYLTGPDGTPERDAILARLKAICGGRVYDDITGTQQLAADPTTGEVLPYVLVTYSSPTPNADGRILGGTELDQPYLMGIQVECWATTRRVAGQVAGVARRVLIGFQPNEQCGEIRALGGASFTLNQVNVGAARAMEQVRLVVPMNQGIPA